MTNTAEREYAELAQRLDNHDFVNWSEGMEKGASAIRALLAREERLKEALEPFRDIQLGDEPGASRVLVSMIVGDLRRARAAFDGDLVQAQQNQGVQQCDQPLAEAIEIVEAAIANIESRPGMRGPFFVNETPTVEAFCNKCGFVGRLPVVRGMLFHNRPGDGKECRYTARRLPSQGDRTQADLGKRG